MKKKILIVDDAIFMRMCLKRELEELNCDFLEAENGEVACELFQKERPNLVVMDISMPVMDGIEALIVIRKIDRNVPVIICSAMGQESMVINAIKAGASDFITKPFVHGRVLSSVRKLLAAQED